MTTSTMAVEQHPALKELATQLRHGYNRILGNQTVRAVRLLGHGDISLIEGLIDTDQSFSNLVERSRDGRRLLASLAPATVAWAVTSAREQTERMIEEYGWPAEIATRLRGVEYWRVLKALEGDQSIFELVAHSLAGSDGSVSDSLSTNLAKHAIPLGLLRDEPGTMAFLLL